MLCPFLARYCFWAQNVTHVYNLLMRSISDTFFLYFVFCIFCDACLPVADEKHLFLFSYFLLLSQLQTGNATNAIESKSTSKQPQISPHLINPDFSFRNPQQSRSRDPIFCDTKIERAGGREVVSRSVS